MAWQSSALTVRVRGLTHLLAGPQGFTLSIGGSLAVAIGHAGYRGLLPVWLFVLGAGAGFCAIALASGAHRDAPMPIGMLGLALLNLVPVAVLPLAAMAMWWIDNVDAAFFVCGLVAAASYVLLFAALIVIGSRAIATSDASDSSR